MVQIKLAEYETIDFEKSGDRRISEYIFGQYAGDLSDDFTFKLDEMDREQENFNEFLELLSEKFKKIKSLPLKDFLGSYINRSDYEPPSMGTKGNKLELLDIEKVNESIEDLNDADTIARLSGLGEFTSRVMSVTGTPTKKPFTTNQQLSRYIKSEEDNLERKMYSRIIEKIEIIEYNTALVITCNAMDLSKELLQEENVSQIREGTVKTNDASKLIIIEDIPHPRKNKDGKARFTDINGRKWESLKKIIDPKGLIEFKIPREAEIIGTDLEKKRFFINEFLPDLGNILRPKNIVMTLNLRNSNKAPAKKILEEDKKDITGVVDMKIEITTKELFLTDKPLLEGDKDPKGKVSLTTRDKRGPERMSLPPHLTFGRGEKQTAVGKEGQRARFLVNRFFTILANNTRRLERQIREIGGNV